jgi:hypothetical protein
MYIFLDSGISSTIDVMVIPAVSVGRVSFVETWGALHEVEVGFKIEVSYCAL